MNVAEQTLQFRETLENEMSHYGVAASSEALDGLVQYYQLLNAWNQRLHLVSFHSAAEFATRHVLESLFLLKFFPRAAHVVDVGSGGGLPIIPCLIVRADLRAVLVEAARKKTVFLNEVLRRTSTKARAQIIGDRFENVGTLEADFLTCRALERFQTMLPRLTNWAPAHGTMLLFGGAGLGSAIENLGLVNEKILLPNSARRFLFIIKKT